MFSDLAANLGELANILQTILNNDTTQRKQAEVALNELKRSDPNKYTVLMVYILDSQFPTTPEVKSLASVILRRNISTSAVDSSDVNDVANNANLWQRLSDENRDVVKKALIQVLRASSEWPKHLIHKICSLAVEI